MAYVKTTFVDGSGGGTPITAAELNKIGDGIASVEANAQPLDADLTALAASAATAGLVERTGAAAYTTRLIGTANSTDIPTRNDVFTHPGRISGRAYLGFPQTWNGGSAVTLNQLIATPFFIGKSTSFDRIVFASTGVASSFFRVGIYSNNNGVPDALIVDAGQVNTASAAELSATIAQTLSGWVWLAGVGQGVAPAIVKGTATYGQFIGTTTAYSTGGGTGYGQTGISGALPASWGATYTELGYSSVVPILYLRPA